MSSNYHHLLNALNNAVGVRDECEDGEELLKLSFAEAVLGLSATWAGLFLVRSTEGPPELSPLFHHDSASSSEDGIALGLVKDEKVATLIGATVESRMLQFVRSSRESSEKFFSALSVPVKDPVLKEVLAVLYFEKEGETEAAFQESDKTWADVYASLLGQAFEAYFQRCRTEAAEVDPDYVEPIEDGLHLIGDSGPTQNLRRDLHNIYIPTCSAPDPEPLLILGEKGTGKDLVARYLYHYSHRKKSAFVAVNCAEITDELAASRFFGHKRGSFTSSCSDEPGFFRAADRGVLFLDEIAELSPRAQATLLRVLENRTVVPVGGTTEVRVDVQVILATNRDPEKAVLEGVIKPDLFDRFRTQVITLPPIRERPWDIPSLARHFLRHHERRMQKNTLGFDHEALRTMVGYSWPGNVREIARVCSLLVTMAKPNTRIGRELLIRSYSPFLGKDFNPKAGPLLFEDLTMRKAMKVFEREIILGRLMQHNWNVRSARESLGLPKTTFHRYVRELGIDVMARRAV